RLRRRRDARQPRIRQRDHSAVLKEGLLPATAPTCPPEEIRRLASTRYNCPKQFELRLRLVLQPISEEPDRRRGRSPTATAGSSSRGRGPLHLEGMFRRVDGLGLDRRQRRYLHDHRRL